MPDPLPPVPSAQGTVVTFAGVPIGRVIGWADDAAAGSVYDATGRGCTIRGTGANTRVVMKRDVTMVDPGRLVLRILGPPTFTKTDIGTRGTLYLLVAGEPTSAPAFLHDFQREGERGGLVQALYTFLWE